MPCLHPQAGSIDVVFLQHPINNGPFPLATNLAQRIRDLAVISLARHAAGESAFVGQTNLTMALEGMGKKSNKTTAQLSVEVKTNILNSKSWLDLPFSFRISEDCSLV